MTDSDTQKLHRRVDVYIAMLEADGEMWDGALDELVSDDAMGALGAILESMEAQHGL